MNFQDALSAVFNDSDRVTRAHWNNRRIYIDAVESQLCIVGFADASAKDDGLPHPWTVTEQDYYADDWEVVEDG